MPRGMASQVNRFWYLLLLAIPAGFRLRLYPDGLEFFEYGSFFVYLTDILAILFLVAFWLSANKSVRADEQNLYLRGFLAVAFISVFFASFIELSIYNFIRLVLYVSTAVMAAYLLRDKAVFLRSTIILAGIGVFEALVGILQFVRQGPVGLGYLGEPELVLDSAGVSRVFTSLGAFLRATGTFPHPNIFAGFLVIAFLILLYWFVLLDKKLYTINRRASLRRQFLRFVDSPSFFYRILVSSSMAAVVFALIVSFSRSAWIAASLGALFFIGFSVRSHTKAILRLLAILAVILIFSIGISFPLFSDRILNSAQDISPSLSERWVYGGVGIYLTKTYPFGVGIGNSTVLSAAGGLFEALHFSSPWQWQPAHNLYLLISSELGVFGLLVFLSFVFILFFGSAPWYEKKKLVSLERLLTLSITASLLIIGFFDHYLWTLVPGISMFWVSISLAISQSSPERGLDLKKGKKAVK